MSDHGIAWMEFRSAAHMAEQVAVDTGGSVSLTAVADGVRVVVEISGERQEHLFSWVSLGMLAKQAPIETWLSEVVRDVGIARVKQYRA